ncbi:MAG TPA: hypothetical protein VNO21_26045 [Polyangiaceae bacterium]|nr:hypothetical protein [Polyangiaceae bacterium]
MRGIKSGSLDRNPRRTAALTVDVARWPIVVLTYEGKPAHCVLAEHLREIEEKVLSVREPFVQVIDQTQGDIPDALQRAQIAEHQAKMGDAYRRFCVGEAYVCSSRMRSAMIAVFWQAPPPYPYTFVRTLTEALAWARHQWASTREHGGTEKPLR